MNLENTLAPHLTITDYCEQEGIKLTIEQHKKFAVKCKSMCNVFGFVIGKVPYTKFVTLDTYPLDVLKSVIK